MIVDREAASDLGVPVGTVADTLRVLVGGLPISKFRDGDEQYDVWLRAEARDRATAQDLYELTLPSPTVGLVKLASLAKLVDERGPTEIERLGRERIVTVLGNPESIPLGEAVVRAEKILQEMNLPPQYSYVFTGQAKTLGETGYYFLVAFGLSIIFMYLILAAQFESWTQPIAILMALPVTMPFGLLSLVLFRTPMDLYAMFGLFMLVGIVKKNGILQVDATNQLRARGLPRARGDRRGEPHPAAADPDDDGDAGRRHGPDRLRPGTRRGRPGQHGQGDHRRPDALAGPGPAGHAGLLRPARHVRQLHPPARHPLLRRARDPAPFSAGHRARDRGGRCVSCWRGRRADDRVGPLLPSGGEPGPPHGARSAPHFSGAIPGGFRVANVMSFLQHDDGSEAVRRNHSVLLRRSRFRLLVD